MNEVGRLLDLIGDRFGLARKDHSRDQLNRAVEEMCAYRRMPPEALVALAETNDGVLRALAGYLTVEESFFLRHPEHYEVLIRAVRALLKDREASSIVICSLGCSHGQEPYSIAIACAEELLPHELSRVRIIASDLNPDAIESARRGRYHNWSFRGLSPTLKARYFRPMKDDTFVLSREIREMVAFHCLSIQEHAMHLGWRSVDFLFFRNVVIYLTGAAQRKAFIQCGNLLRPGGMLFTAPSDLTPPKELFRLVGDATSIFSGVSGEESDAPSLLRAPPKRGLIVVCPPRPVAPNAVGLEVSGQEARHLSALPIRTADPIKTCGTYIAQGQQHLENDSLESALTDFRHATLLCPNDPIARFWYAVALQRHGLPRRSLGQIEQIISVLGGLPTKSLLSDGQTTAADLMVAAQQLKERLL